MEPTTTCLLPADAPKAIGVLGGTFDPIHCAHLHLAQKSLEIFQLDQVHFLIARRPPHKSPRSITSAYHRFAMTSSALEPFPRFLASTVELELEEDRSNYTWDTLYAICRHYHLQPEALFFIAGGDSFLTVNTWKNFEQLLAIYNFVFIDRPDACIGKDFSHLPTSLCRRIVDLRLHPNQVRASSSAIYLLETGAPAISSSEIRERIIHKTDFSHLVPEAVHQYILKYHLYI